MKQWVKILPRYLFLLRGQVYFFLCLKVSNLQKKKKRMAFLSKWKPIQSNIIMRKHSTKKGYMKFATAQNKT